MFSLLCRSCRRRARAWAIRLCGKFSELQLLTATSFLFSLLLSVGRSHSEILFSYLYSAARESRDNSLPSTHGSKPFDPGMRRGDPLSAPYLPFCSSGARISNPELFSKIKPLGPVGNCMVPLHLQYAATRVRSVFDFFDVSVSVSPPVPRDFAPVHPQMVDDLVKAGVMRPSRSIPISSSSLFSFHDTIPIFHLLKHSVSQTPELLTIYDARYINACSAIEPVAFSLYNFDALSRFQQQCAVAGRELLFSKHDWRKFYPSLRLGRESKAGFRKGSCIVEMVTDRAVFGRATEPAIGQAVNQSLWREAAPPSAPGSGDSSSPVFCVQILDDTLCSHWEPDVLDSHFNRFRKLGIFNGLREHESKIADKQRAVIFCGKHVTSRCISHPLRLWARSVLRLVCMVHACSRKKHMQILLGNAQWLAGHGNLARPFLLPLYYILHFTRLRTIPTGYVSRCFFSALALATVPRSVSWGLHLCDFNPAADTVTVDHPAVYVDAAHDYGLACMVVVTGDAASSWCMQINVPVGYRGTQQKAERWALYWALGWCCRRRIQPKAVCADNMGAILADFSLSAPCADWLLVRLAQKLSRLLLRHFPTLAMSHVQGTLNPADLGTRQIFPFSVGAMFRAPDSMLALHSLCVTTPGAFSNPESLLKQKISSFSFPAGGPFWKQPPA